jgi:UDP-N-acetylglucosamine--N-acetylmuramyl-(pentapeptide) pyrophosphoryl-undecaprenol N-acetylglucosamine transferase
LARTQKKLLIVAGGTGGHIMPALAVANLAKDQGVEIHWLGTPHGLENKLKLGFPLYQISIKGLRNKGLLGWLLLPFRLLFALAQTLKILIKVKPNAVFCFGGYVSFPAGFCAWLIRIPVMIQEQNSIAGLSNKALSYFAQKIFTAYPGAIKSNLKKQLLTGNPVRDLFINSTNNIKYSQDKSVFNILVIGGSQGALNLNKIIPKALKNITAKLNIVHQCGANHLKITQLAYEQAGIEAKVVQFINDMPESLAISDLVICRAGALTLAEITQVGKPSILIPFPYAVDNHQYFNARYLADNNAAIICSEDTLEASKLSEKINKFIDDPKLLSTMGRNAKKLSRPNACKDIVNECMRIL